MRDLRLGALIAVLALAAVGCSEGPAATLPLPEPTSTADPTPSVKPKSPRPIRVPLRATPTAEPRPTHERVVTEQRWVPFAATGGITLSHPSRRVERVAFHQSNHEGAQQMRMLPSAVASSTLESRDRLTPSRTAADVVIDPAVEVRAPVTGRVKRAGTYVLYCEHSDDYVVIEPDDHPGWEVKLLHIDGVRVRPGDRVTARSTVIAPRPTKLPFESQVDETSAQPPWPHVHIEVVDPSIPNKPSPGSGC